MTADPTRTALARLVEAVLTDIDRIPRALREAEQALAEPPVPSVPVAALADLVGDWRRTVDTLTGDDPAVESARLVWGQAARELSALVSRLSGLDKTPGNPPEPRDLTLDNGSEWFAAAMAARGGCTCPSDPDGGLRPASADAYCASGKCALCAVLPPDWPCPTNAHVGYAGPPATRTEEESQP